MSNYGQQDVLRNTCFPGADGGVDGVDKGRGREESRDRRRKDRIGRMIIFVPIFPPTSVNVLSYGLKDIVKVSIVVLGTPAN